MSPLDGPTRTLIRLAAAIATGNGDLVSDRVQDAFDDEVPRVWLDELVLQSVLMCGYPRALAAAGQVREAAGEPPVSLEDGGDFGLLPSWAARGEATCRTIYGANYDKLRANVQRLHPALDAWMVVEGYGRTLSRPGLDLVRRELAVIAQVTVLGAERQLHSHLRGALNAGASPEVVSAALRLAAADATPEAGARAHRLWQRIAP